MNYLVLAQSFFLLGLLIGAIRINKVRRPWVFWVNLLGALVLELFPYIRKEGLPVLTYFVVVVFIGVCAVGMLEIRKANEELKRVMK